MTDYAFPKASLKHRLGQAFLEYGLAIVTLGIGYLIWTLILFGRGQTPGKQILKLRVYDLTTGLPAKWGHMFIREFGLFMVIGVFAYAVPIAIGLQSLDDLISQGFTSFGFGDLLYYGLILLDALWIFKGGNRHRLVDVVCKTDVLNEAHK